MLGNVTGGLSGPAIKPVALYMVYTVSPAIDVPVIGCGGISTALDATEFFMAGASAVEVGTAGLVNPGAPFEILQGIKRFLEDEGISRLSDIIGVAAR